MLVQSVVRAFDILKTIAAHPEGIGVTDVAQQTNLHKSTVSRLIATLEHTGAVGRLPESAWVQIHPDFVSLFAHSTNPQNLVSLARPYLIELSAITGEDAGLAIPEGDQAFYIDQVQSDQPVQVRDWTGTHCPLHTVSAGKLFLAHRSPVEQERYLARPLVAHTPDTITDPEQLRQLLPRIREKKLAWIFNEFAEGLNAVAAPIMNRQGDVIAALSIYGPSFRFPPEGRQEELNDLIRRASKRLTRQVQEISTTNFGN